MTSSDKEAQKNFEMNVEKDTLYITLRGNLGGLNLSALQAWGDDAVKTLEEAHEKNTGPIKVIVDINGITGYEPDALNVLATTLRNGGPHIYKVAAYGGSPFIQLAEEAVFSMSGLENVKAFNTKEDALRWVQS